MNIRAAPAVFLLLALLLGAASAQDLEDSYEQKCQQAQELFAAGEKERAIELAEQTLEEAIAQWGDDEPITLVCLHTLANLLALDGQLERAEPLLRSCLRKRREVLGDEVFPTLLAMHALADVLFMQGRLAEALPLYEEFVATCRARGAEPQLATLIRLGHCCFVLGFHGKALPIFEGLLMEFRDSLGEDRNSTLNYLDTSDILADLYFTQERYATMLPLVQEALAIRRQVLGSEDLNTLHSLNSLGLVYLNLGRFAEAEATLMTCYESLRAQLGPTGAEVLVCQGNLAQVFASQGRYDEAQAAFESIRDRQTEAFGPDDLNTLTTLHNLGNLLRARGRYTEAEIVLGQVLAERSRVLGPNDRKTLATMNALAGVIGEQARYEEAAELHLRCLEARRASLGAEDHHTLSSLNNLAGIYEELGRDEEAEALLRECHEVHLKFLAADDIRSLISLSNLATIIDKRGRGVEAESLFLQCLGGRQRVLGADHLSTLVTRQNLGLLWQDQGRLAEASVALEQVLVARRAKLGEAHPQTLRSVYDRASLYFLTGEGERGAALLLEACVSGAAWLEGVLLGLTRPQRVKFLQSYRRFEAPFRIVQGLAVAGLLPAEAGLRQLLWRKGLLMRIATRVERQAHVRDAPPEVGEALQALAGARGRYANLTTSKSDGALVGAELKSLADQIHGLEKGLALALRDQLGTANTPEQALHKMQASLAEDEALVVFSVQQELDGNAALTSKWQYCAFVMRSDAILAVPLCAADEVEAAIEGLRRAISAPGPLGRVLQQRATNLYTDLWAPLEAALEGARSVRVAPAGKLHLLPFAALIDAEGRYLCEELNLSLTATGLELLGPVAGTAREGALLCGGVDFGPGGPFAALPATELETNELQALFAASGHPTHLLSGEAATEDSLETLVRELEPRFVHVATHGIFTASERTTVTGDEAVRSVATPSDDPLGLCGLALAGVNQPTPERDGRLSAYEVIGLRLAGAELVTLSGCNTGVGNVDVGESSGSLGEAFLRAGARRVLMSLWPVEDAATRAFMVRFYELLLQDEPPALALAQVRQEWLSSADPKRAHPRAWAGMVLVGER